MFDRHCCLQFIGVNLSTMDLNASWDADKMGQPVLNIFHMGNLRSCRPGAARRKRQKGEAEVSAYEGAEGLIALEMVAKSSTARDGDGLIVVADADVVALKGLLLVGGKIRRPFVADTGRRRSRFPSRAASEDGRQP
jgi:hypothetical protein